MLRVFAGYGIGYRLQLVAGVFHGYTKPRLYYHIAVIGAVTNGDGCLTWNAEAVCKL